MVSGRATVVGFTVNQHQWLPGLRAAVRDRQRARSPRTRRSGSPPTSSAASPTRCTSARRSRSASSSTTTCGSRCSSRPATTDPAERVPEPQRPTPRPPVSDDRFEHRVGAVGRRSLGDRPPADGRPAVAHGRRLPRRGRRRRPRRSTTSTGCRPIPVPCPMGHERGRRHRGRGGAAPPADVDQRRRRAPRARRLGDRGDARGGERAVPPRPVLPHGVGVDVRDARASRRRRAAAVSGPLHEWRAPFGAMSAANWIAHERQPVPPPLRRRRARCSGWIALNGRANAARNPAAIYRDPMTMDDYLVGPPDHDAVRALRLRRAVRRVDRGHRVRRVGRRRPARSRPIRVEAVGTQITERISWDQDTITHEPQVLGQSAHLWTRTEPAPGRRRPRPRLRRLHVQRHLLARGARVLRPRRGEGLARRRPPHRARRRPPGQPARRPAVRGPHPRLRVPLRGDDAAPPRGRRAPGRRRAHRGGHLRRRHPVGRAAAPPRRSRDDDVRADRHRRHRATCPADRSR